MNGESAELTIDPVCGMQVKTDDAPCAEHAGKTYFFCCQGCRGVS